MLGGLRYHCVSCAAVDGTCCCREVDPIPPERIHEYAAQLIDGLSFLHFEKVGCLPLLCPRRSCSVPDAARRPQIVHRDVKPGNLLIDADGFLKIADFGVSQMFDGDNDEFRNTAGTASFMAPEMTTGESFSGKVRQWWTCRCVFRDVTRSCVCVACRALTCGLQASHCT